MPTARTPSIRLVMNGTNDSLIVDGRVFDRSALRPHERREMAAIVRSALFPGADRDRPRHRGGRRRG